MATREGWIHDLVRGWDTVIHTGRMLLFSLIWAGAVSLALLLVVAGTYSYQNTSAEQRQVSILWVKSAGWHVLHSDGRTIKLKKNGKVHAWPSGQVYRSPEIRQVVKETEQIACRGLLYGSFCAVCLFCLVLLLALRRGRKMRLDQLIRGSERVAPEDLAAKLREEKKASDILLGRLPMVAGSEPQHIFITGAPGTGKSVLISSILDVVRKRGDRAIIYDSSGDFLSRYYRDEDKILNPLDARGELWTPWAEIQSPYDADRLAETLIPAEGKSDPFWSQAARQLLTGALTRLPVRDVGELLKNLLTTDLSALAGVVEGTDAAALLGEGNEKMALSVRATLATYVRSLRFLRSGTIDEPFSVREWVQKESSSWLYVTSRSDQHAALRPLITCWLDAAASAIMSLPPSRARRIWIILDELPHLSKMPSIPQLLAMGRKYGACCVMGIQSISQLRDIYGRDGAEALAGMASTWVVFRTPDPDTADWTSRAAGESDLDEAQESISYSSEETRDGVNLRNDRKTRRVIMPSEIMFLPDLQAFVRLPGAYPITQVPLTFKDRPEVAKPYEQTDLETTVWGRMDIKEETAEETEEQPEEETKEAAIPVPTESTEDPETVIDTEDTEPVLDYKEEGGRGWY
jgi:type IV conjugative transfer system coupling protein TraD